MRRRMLAAALACTLLAGCGPVRTEPVEQETPRAGAPVIAYVPLDDRPDNAERVVYLAESLGYELAMPERDLYRTRLDGQPPNENGTQYGDRGALYEWVAKQEAAGCDRYILSLDQLLSGGLVSSRAMTGENPVTLSSGETLVEAELLTAVIAPAGSGGEQPDLVAGQQSCGWRPPPATAGSASTSTMPCGLTAWHPVPTWRARI